MFNNILMYLYYEYGMKITNKGVQYLAQAIAEVYNDKTWSVKMTKLYMFIADKNDTSWKSVERLARNEVKKISDNKLGEFIFRQAIIIKQKQKKKERNLKNEFCKETQQRENV